LEKRYTTAVSALSGAPSQSDVATLENGVPSAEPMMLPPASTFAATPGGLDVLETPARTRVLR
jgi:hypothetical protein